MKTFSTTDTPLGRMHSLINDYFAATDDADIEVRIGWMQDNQGTHPSVCMSIAGKDHGMSVHKARVIADIAEGAMNKFPNERDARTLPNLILALRAGADAAEKAGIVPNER